VHAETAVTGGAITWKKTLVCGMQVDPTKAAGKSEVDGKTYCFCSKGCKAKCDANPAQYTKQHQIRAGPERPGETEMATTDLGERGDDAELRSCDWECAAAAPC
jgi:YHS domain-containing protein